MSRRSEDLRESLCNDRQTGTAAEIAVPRERITRLHTVLLDFDPHLYVPENALFRPDEDPDAFFANIKPVLDRHPLARFAEIRASGTGLHALLWLQPVVELTTAADQERWKLIVQAVQASLPIDPDMPDITALTRPIGAVNSKNGAAVRQLQAGEPISPAAVEEYVRSLTTAPFRQVALPLLGSERCSPCPVCQGPGTRLDVLDFQGRCYGGCSKVAGAQLYDVIFLPPPDRASSTKERRPRRTAKTATKKKARQQSSRKRKPAGAGCT
ncbi:MAG: hypothetical protein JNM56_33800 [Planctomycetia bacterium]|nr:hypothetical protein [Planctomycetia bacterium]